MEVVQVSPKGQILIPKRIRDRCGVKPGAKVLLFEGQEGLVIKPAPEDPIEAACGFIQGDFSLTKDLIEEHRREVKRDRARGAR